MRLRWFFVVLLLAVGGVWLLGTGEGRDAVLVPRGEAPDAGAGGADLRGSRDAERAEPTGSAPAPAEAATAPREELVVRLFDRDGTAIWLGDISERVVLAHLPAAPGVGRDDMPRSLWDGRELSEALISGSTLQKRIRWEGGGEHGVLAWSVPRQQYEGEVPGHWRGRVGIAVLGQWWADKPARAGEVVELVVDTRAWIDGRARLDLQVVMDRDDAVLSSQWVRLRHLESGASARTRWDPDPGDGVLHLGGLLPGTYEVVVTSSVRVTWDKARFTAWRGEAPGPLPAVAGRISLRAGEHAHHTLRYRLPGRIRARFRDTEGQPAVYGRTSIGFVTEDGVPMEVGTSAWDVAADDVGTKMLENVPSGRGHVLFGGRSHPVEVPPGGIVDLVLPEAEAVGITVHFAAEQPERRRRVWLIDRRGVEWPATGYLSSDPSRGRTSEHYFPVVPGKYQARVLYLDGASVRHPARTSRRIVDEDGDPSWFIELSDRAGR